MKTLFTLAALAAAFTFGGFSPASAATSHPAAKPAHVKVAAAPAPPACCVGGKCCAKGACCAMPGCCTSDGSCCDAAKGTCTASCGCPGMSCCAK